MIFIVGMPRSGTSLVEQILTSHSKVFGGGELSAMGEATGELLYHFSLQPDVKLTETGFGLIGQTYLDNISEIECFESIITDKMPHNFLRLGFIHAAFPEAKIIHINRDPMAVCWSSFKNQFKSRGMDYSYSLENLAHHYRAYLDLMDF
ncbi:MAG: sulfotransferase [PS1 clade bacterium]|uniref:Sulfotransferase n=1 Tax=PS1 clade bacterium TaxID=2175152 RepID=A0A368EEF3_9PROT|nr:MAG: sulfotransferase [PS1 clade bacterium]